ncbi:sensor domain-containing diguanylate cyclase [Brevibacillus fluminis]|nr:sensor domain-containing diguanylate cyclase [Brevibacillus fluminis]
MHKQMLGKLETVFSYMTHFLLYTWPENRPGILFLTDAKGCLLHMFSMQVGQTWIPGAFHWHAGESLAQTPESVVMRAIDSGQIVSCTASDFSGEQDCAIVALPLKESDGRIRAIIGLALPEEELAFDLMSYMRGLEPLVYMGYDAYIQHTTSDIVMNINRYDHYAELVQSLIQEIVSVIDKGVCSAVKLDEKGYLLPQERYTTEEIGTKSDTQLAQILPLYIHEPIKPMTSEDRRLIIFPIQSEGKPLTALFLHLPADETELSYDDRDVAFLQQIGEKISYTLLRTIIADNTRRDVQKKEMLYQITKKIQATIDVDEVLTEIIQSLHSLYPYFQADLYLTVETNTTLPVKQLTFSPGENVTSSQAYMEGKLISNQLEEDGQQVTVIAAPLLGKQGMYGVLQLSAKELVNIDNYETDYISILAETAGTAFENAQLYQQSRNLIRELRLINEMAQQLNRSLNLDEILQFVTTMLLTTFEAEYCAILQKDLDEDQLIVLSASNPAHAGERISALQQPLHDTIRSKQAVILANPSTETMPFSLVPFASLMAVPLLQESEVSGVLLVCDSRHHFFSFDDFKLLEIFGQHTSLAITNAMLHSEVERMVITDNLTGLSTRRYLGDQVQGSLSTDSAGSLILMDVDYFKSVNDTYGHQVGDEVLIQVANLIKSNIRDSDVAARWGGEELAVYLPHVEEATAFSVAERIRASVEQETNPRVTISCGLATWNREGDRNMSVESMFHTADVALYEAKRQGRNQVRTAY